MLVGVPREIKTLEFRVGLTTASVSELVHRGHQVIVQSGAGEGVGLTDAMYRNAGAEIVTSAAEVFDRAELLVKVKEPQPEECRMLRPGQVLFTYLHLAPDPEQTRMLIESGCIAIAYETVTDEDHCLPLLAPMSEVAGRMSIQVGAHALEKHKGGSGVLLGGVPGVEAARVVVIGGGVVGTSAARMAMGMGAQVTVLGRSLNRLKALDLQFGCMLNTVYSTGESVRHYVTNADLVIGAVLVPGAAAPKLVTRDMLREMRPGSVVVDVAIDQGGCFETSRPTTHAEPTYLEEGIVHYCVTNMPGGVARTSAFALNNATLPFTLALADKGYRQALLEDPHLRNGLNVHEGRITYEAVASAHGYDYLPADKALAT
jgi:alanine dehydrogenase